MRPMSEGELDSWYERGRWPCGHGTEYRAGPSGGFALSVECPRCGLRLNIVDPECGQSFRFGQVLSAPEGYVPPQPMNRRQRAINRWRQNLRLMIWGRSIVTLTMWLSVCYFVLLLILGYLLLRQNSLVGWLYVLACYALLSLSFVLWRSRRLSKPREQS